MQHWCVFKEDVRLERDARPAHFFILILSEALARGSKVDCVS